MRPVAGFLLSAAVLAGAACGANPKPNVLVILCDDLGYGDLACFGHNMIRTPHLDRLAKQGWRLTDCYSSSPVCSPSRVGLLTGRTPSRAGVFDWIPGNNEVHLRQEEVTIPQLLKQGGYDTAMSGKWHCNGKFNSPAQPQPGDHGFDHWFATQNNASPTHENPKNFVRNGKPVGLLRGFSCQLVADDMIAWWKSGWDKDRPFFSYVAFHEPHEPCASPKEMIAYYESKGATKRGEAIYYANVENMDAAVGKLMKALDDEGLADNTLVYFSSDNGPETLNRYKSAWRSHGTPGPLRGMKLWLFEAGMRVPGIVRWPGRTTPGKLVGTPVCSLDLLPTLCELAGVTPPKGRTLDGTSIVPFLRGQPLERDKPLFWHYHNALGEPKTAMRDGDWMILGKFADGTRGNVDRRDTKKIRSLKLTEFELYNVRTDISQKNDIADKELERTKTMSNQLVSRYTEVLAEAPVWPMAATKPQPRKK